VSRKWRNWYQNKVDEEIKGFDSRNKVNHDKRSEFPGIPLLDKTLTAGAIHNKLTWFTLSFDLEAKRLASSGHKANVLVSPGIDNKLLALASNRCQNFGIDPVTSALTKASGSALTF